MKKTVIICPDPFKKETWSVAEVDDVCAYLKQQFDMFPEFAKIYHDSVAQQNDITPKSKRDIDHLQKLNGVFYVVIYPAWIQLIYFAVVAIMAAYAVYSILTMPKMNNNVAGSGNNELQSRSNRARLKGRIPDIYGRVRAYPDLAANTYTVYQDGVEIEECLMCVGRGYYQIHDVRDADTAAEGISGISVSIYDPDKSIIGTDTIYKIGQTFTELPLSITKSASINGQTLQSPNSRAISDNTTLYFMTGGIIRSTDASLNFTEFFSVGDGLEISGAVIGIDSASVGGSMIAYEDGTLVITTDDTVDHLESYQRLTLVGVTFSYSVVGETDPQIADLSGSYTIATASHSVVAGKNVYTVELTAFKQVNYNWNYVTENNLTGTAKFEDSNLGVNLDDVYSVSAIQNNQITLANASTVNDDWDKIGTLYNGSTQGLSVEVSLDIVNTHWVGWMEVYKEDATKITFNVYFPQGLYGVNKKGKQHALQIGLIFQFQHLSNSGIPTGAIDERFIILDINNPSSFGRTYTFDLQQVGNCRFRIAKTNVDTPWANNITESKIKDVYLSSAYDKHAYEGVTIIRTRQVATDGALSLKERKLNCLVTRKLAVDGTGSLVATRDAGQALINLALDKYVGRRSSFEIDIAQIKSEIDKIKLYFGSSDAAEFNYTFDDDQLSFEEQAGMIASACFSECKRFGNKLRLSFEKPQTTSVLLFNHRNKVPQSEKRTYSFGIKNDYDGIKIEYTSPDDDERVNYYLSYNRSTGVVTEDSTATNPLEITTSGIRNHAVAKTRAWREWNKLQHQRVSVEFDALDESELLTRNDRVLVADNTSLATQDGEITAIDALILTCSQNVEFEAGVQHFCHLQMQNATVDIIECTPGEMTNQIILTRPPMQPLVVDPDRYVKTLYSVIKATDSAKSIFMLSEMNPNDQMTNKLVCVNYSDKYYEKDHSFI
ncbi:MAG: host specificity factor TipJ family phage tail protein [Acinetobacter sp.]